MSFGARVELRLDALNANFNRLKATVPGCRVLAAVKANAYGHGMLEVARALGDADALAVARLVEAEALRNDGIATDIVLMGGVITADELREAEALDCGVVVHTEHQVSLMESVPVSPRRTWLKIDTGMHRLGVYPADARALLSRLRSAPSVTDLGLMTHFANADDPCDPRTGVQIERFARVAEDFDGDLSVANSAALLRGSEGNGQDGLPASGGRLWIRPGISLYGISPLVGSSAHDLGLRPVMNFDTCLVAVKPLAAGEPVGYGGHWTAPMDTQLGIAAAGYGDGYSRFIPSGTPVLVNGRRVPVAGTISMDLMAVDLGPDAVDEVGDPVRLWGEGLPVEEIAGHAGTTAYPLVTGVRDRHLSIR